MSSNNCVVFYWYEKEGQRFYRCRGYGAKYDKFYREWINSSSYRCTYENFPWDFFVFDNPIDWARLERDFPGDVYEDNREDELEEVYEEEE